jgi:DNA-binding transcriptional LysR family regulator
MEIRSLRYAVTLADELHFGRAAQRHFISAQPLGRTIQQLEREVAGRHCHYLGAQPRPPA